MSIDYSKLIPAAEVAKGAMGAQKETVAARRYKAETAGIIVQGIEVNTERDSQNLINGAVVSCLINPEYVCNWKTPAGFIQLNAEQITAFGVAVRNHVQACFDREAELVAALEDGSYTKAMLEEGWPA